MALALMQKGGGWGRGGDSRVCRKCANEESCVLMLLSLFANPSFLISPAEGRWLAGRTLFLLNQWLYVHMCDGIFTCKLTVAIQVNTREQLELSCNAVDTPFMYYFLL